MTVSTTDNEDQRRRPGPAVLAMGWTLLLLLVGFLVVPPAWRDTDDLRMAMIASDIGSADGPSEFLIYSNILIGRVLRWLYENIPDAPWYGLYLIAVQAVAHACVTWAVLTLRPKQVARLALASSHLAIFLYFWTHLQFTSTSALATVSGTTLLAMSMLKDHTSGSFPLTTSVLGWLLIILGSLIRFTSCGLICLLSTPVLIPLLSRLRQPIRMINHAATAAVALTVLFGCAKLNSQAYNEDDQMREFRQMQFPMARIVNNIYLRFLSAESMRGTIDEQTGDQDRLNSALDDVGLTNDDLQCMFNWLFFDPETFSRTRFEQLHAALGQNYSSAGRLRMAWAVATGQLAREPMFVLIAGLSLALFLNTGAIGWRLWFAAGTWLFGLAVLCGILVWMKLPPRVFLPACTACLVGMTVLLHSSSDDTDRRASESGEPLQRPGVSTRVGSIGLVIVCVAALYTSLNHYRFSRQYSEDRASFSAELQSLISEDKFCVVTVPFPFESLSPLDNLDWMKSWQFVFLDGHQRSPRYQAIIGQRRFRSLTELLISDPDVLLVSMKQRSLDLIEQFYANHHGVQLKFERQAKRNWFYTFTIRTDDAPSSTESVETPSQPAGG